MTDTTHLEREEPRGSLRAGARIATGRVLVAIAAIALLPGALDHAQAQGTPPYAIRDRMPQPVIFGPGTISTADDESHPTFSPDGRTLYFLKNAPRFDHWTLVSTQYDDGAWQKPEVVPFSGRYADADLFIARGGEDFYFISTRPPQPDGEALAHTDVWKVRREGNDWSEPERIEELSSDGNEWYPTMTDSGVLYFGSERRKDNRGRPGTSDLWRSRLVEGRFTRPQNLGPAINTAGNDIEPYISPDETFMIFASSGRPDSLGVYDLYVTYYCDGHWTDPQNLGEPINSSAWDFSPRISPDGRYLFFTSNRGFGDRPPEKRLDYEELERRLHSPGNGLRDIYQVDLSALNLRPGC
jgi:Tol biopolymer transport system component